MVILIIPKYFMNSNVTKALMFVDDELLILLSISTQVRRNFGDQFRYLTAQSADEAWEIIEEVTEEGIKILILFSDWLMPGMNGDEFLKRVHAKYPDIEKVIVTGYADQNSIDSLKKEINLKHCFRKPWDELELVELINNTIDN